MIDNETQLILTRGVLGSPDSVPFDAMMEAIETATTEELKIALQEMYLVAAGFVANIETLLADMTNTDLDATPATFQEIVETHFAILEAATDAT
jgi:hypothetical protein